MGGQLDYGTSGRRVTNIVTLRQTGRIALAVDTSGSIDESLLRRFAAEVTAVLVQTEPLLSFINLGKLDITC